MAARETGYDATFLSKPYAELAGVSWADAATARLVELRTVAVEERAAARLAQGAHAEVVAELEYQVAEDPLRARPVEPMRSRSMPTACRPVFRPARITLPTIETGEPP